VGSNRLASRTPCWSCYLVRVISGDCHLSPSPTSRNIPTAPSSPQTAIPRQSWSSRLAATDDVLVPRRNARASEFGQQVSVVDGVVGADDEDLRAARNRTRAVLARTRISKPGPTVDHQVMRRLASAGGRRYRRVRRFRQCFEPRRPPQVTRSGSRRGFLSPTTSRQT